MRVHSWCTTARTIAYLMPVTDITSQSLTLSGRGPSAAAVVLGLDSLGLYFSLALQLRLSLCNVKILEKPGSFPESTSSYKTLKDSESMKGNR